MQDREEPTADAFGAGSLDDVRTYEALLVHSVSVASAARALPENDQGDRLRGSLPAMLAIQAVTLALANLHRLPEDQYAVGQDLAEVELRTRARELNELWRTHAMPDEMLDLMRLCHEAIARTRNAGAEWVVSGIDRSRAMSPRRVAESVLGNLGFLRSEGGTCDAVDDASVLAVGQPAAFVRRRVGGVPRDAVLVELGVAFVRAGLEGRWVPVSPMRQVYMRDAGDPTQNLVASMDELHAGRPLLVPVG
jgi:hypothetical protein